MGGMDDLLRNKAYWRSRRGMQELDTLLIPFVEDRLPSLTPDLQQAYLRLIDREDWELFDWLQGRGEPEEAELKTLVGLLLCTPQTG